MSRTDSNLQKEPGFRPSGILRELLDAELARRHPDLEPALASLGLKGGRGPIWGFAHVALDGRTYRTCCRR
jgi:hypothetical protein